MYPSTLNCLNSGLTKFYEIDGKIIVGIDIEDILQDRVNINVISVKPVDGFEEAPPFEDNIPSVVITDAIKEVYSKLGQDRGSKLYEDVYNYLQLAASCWESSNRSTSAITGSLIGKISKPFSELNELLYKTCGSEARDNYLKELIRSNMPLLQQFWGQKK